MIQAFREGRLGLWALDDMGLLFRGNENMAQLPGPEDHVSQLPVPSASLQDSPESRMQLAALLAPVQVNESMDLIASPSAVPSLITENSPTSLQISSYISNFFELQKQSLTELSTSKNQVKKRDLEVKNEKRKMKWKTKFPDLIKTKNDSKISRGVGLAKGARKPFYIGGFTLKRKIERARSIARKVDKKRAKRRKMSKG